MVVGTKELAGQVAIVTGGAKNIGRATCLDLADAGAAVCVNALTSVDEAEEVADEIRRNQGQAMTFIGDISEPDVVDEMVAAVMAEFGKINILINNASVRKVCALADMDIETFRHIMKVDVEGPFLCARAALPKMIEAGGGTIINIGGLSGHTGVRDRLHVSTAKSALTGMSAALAHEGGPHGVTSNCLVPGRILTDSGAEHEKPPGLRSGNTLTDVDGHPSHISAMVRSLCGPAGRYTTGQTIHVNGGAYTTTG
ncbi:MAG TPA: short-chain dehydrogenase [Rhodospirillaceae bacterium]|nr:short-chain dehydrogenase [Rhodospirillaceae bacterium]HAA91467.1 short-chain dehydrogenase [Rhodospirillaceae bacterium]HAT34201.1 short-chain dehydrogenase [Rhodospirillaceae bacterium]